MARKKEKVLHTLKSPFPAPLRNGGIAIDERCRCGQLRSQHMDTVAYGHGASFDGRCGKFTWEAFVRSE